MLLLIEQPNGELEVNIETSIDVFEEAMPTYIEHIDQDTCSTLPLIDRITNEGTSLPVCIKNNYGVHTTMTMIFEKLTYWCYEGKEMFLLTNDDMVIKLFTFVDTAEHWGVVKEALQ